MLLSTVQCLRHVTRRAAVTNRLPLARWSAPWEVCSEKSIKDFCILNNWVFFNHYYQSNALQVQHRVVFAVRGEYVLWGRVFKISRHKNPESASCRGHTEEMFWVLSSSVFAQAPSFSPHFRSHFDSFGVHFEIRGFKRCCFHPAPSKMNIWLTDKTRGVENQSVNCTISSQPALSCSHQASWLARTRVMRDGSVSCGDTNSESIGMKSFYVFIYLFLITSEPKFVK